MKVQDFSGGGIKHENCHRRTVCDSDRVTDYISIKSNWKIKSHWRYFLLGLF